jgi:hypothetical protein
VPVDRLMCGGTQIGAGGILQAVRGVFSQNVLASSGMDSSSFSRLEM